MRRRLPAVIGYATLLIANACSTVEPRRLPRSMNLGPLTLEGEYQHHLQGVAIDDNDRLFWCHTTELVRTDSFGAIQRRVKVKNHHGGIAWRDGRLYCAVNFGEFNQPAGKADSWVYVYDGETLVLLHRHRVPELVHGAGGIATHDHKFFVVGGLPDQVPENYVYEYDADFRFVQRHVLKSGWTHLGIQTAAFQEGRFYFGCYGSPPQLLITDERFREVSRHTFDAAYGITGVGTGLFFVSPSQGHDKGTLRLARADEEYGLVTGPRPPGLGH